MQQKPSAVVGAAVLGALLLAGCGASPKRGALGLEFPQLRPVPGAPAASRAGDAVDATLVNPFDPVALNNQAVVEAARGRYQQAVALLQRAVRLAPARSDIAANLLSLQRWLAQAEGQAALGLQPQPLQLPLPETRMPDLPPLWSLPPGAGRPTAPAASTALPVAPTPAAGAAAGGTAAGAGSAAASALPSSPSAAAGAERPAAPAPRGR